ncbi:MAG: Kdo hydroxylase family protein [Candidatus Competibacterales bacterium]
MSSPPPQTPVSDAPGALLEDSVVEYRHDDWHTPPLESDWAAVDLENGRVLNFSRLAFPLDPPEVALLTTTLAGRAKNISFDPHRGTLKGHDSGVDVALLTTLLQRFADAAQHFVHGLLPDYAPALRRARTSLRPVEAAGRIRSVNQDDTRLHIDAFPATPTGGGRILRLFSNIDPQGRARQWRVGEPFEAYASHFVPAIKPPFPGSATLLWALKLTKTRRTLYDHYMLSLHRLGKADDHYQSHTPQREVAFAAGSTWVAFTDQVLHAVSGGQYLLEQTFHLPPHIQRRPDSAPLAVLERLTGRVLAPRSTAESP